jgi:ketosteroid isomerase-like protein
MSVADIAKAFLAHVAAGQDDKAQTFWSEDIVSLEGGDGPMAVCRGRSELLKKHEWWGANTKVHAFTVEGPFIHDDRFAAIFEIDAEMQGERRTLREVAVYLVKDGKIVEERFFNPTES